MVVWINQCLFSGRLNSAYWVIFHASLLSAVFFFKIHSEFLKKFFQEYHQSVMSNSLDPDQA